MRLWRGIVLAFLVSALPAAADDAPWVAAAALVRAADADAVSSGLAGIAPHVAELEQVLADGARALPAKPDADGMVVVLVDGPPEALLALAAAANRKQSATALNSPYPEAGLLLTVYYNEIKKYDDAVRVVEATLKLEPVPGTHVGLRAAALLSEEAFAHARLGHWPDSLSAADGALKAAMNDRDKARSQRSRGMALVELNRLNDGEAAYQDSLKLEPDNAVARNELAYIAQLRAGGARSPTQQITPEPPSPAAPENPPI